MRKQQAPPKVFVVDDDRSIVRTITGFLARAGFRTSSASDVAGAMRGIREQNPDLILLDVKLGDESGFDICRSLNAQATAFPTPILFISADESTATKVKGFEIGGVDFITKPIIGAELMARVRTHLRLQRAFARLYELQSDRVRHLASAQQNLMPHPESFPEARFQVDIHQVLTAGGDFYDVIRAGEGVVDYLVADASGHDLAASLWTAALKTLASEYAGPLNFPIEIVRAINGSLCRVLPPGAFFTLIYARLDHRTGRLSIVNAAHPPAIVLPADGSAPVILRQEGDVVGAFDDAVFGATEIVLQPGDRVFFYTDGLIEAFGSYEKGLLNLAASCHGHRALPIRDLVPAVAGNLIAAHSPDDDTLLLGVER